MKDLNTRYRKQWLRKRRLAYKILSSIVFTMSILLFAAAITYSIMTMIDIWAIETCEYYNDCYQVK